MLVVPHKTGAPGTLGALGTSGALPSGERRRDLWLAHSVGGYLAGLVKMSVAGLVESRSYFAGLVKKSVAGVVESRSYFAGLVKKSVAGVAESRGCFEEEENKLARECQ